MASRHSLALDVLDTANPTVLKLSDSSRYAPTLFADCPRLDILVPGFAQPVYLTGNLPPGFVRLIGGQELGLQTRADAPASELPDGVWTLSYSVAPNEQTIVTYYHLRAVRLRNALLTTLAQLRLSPELPSPFQRAQLAQLRLIGSYLDAARAQAEYRQAPEQARQLLAYAELLLARHQAGPCPTC